MLIKPFITIVNTTVCPGIKTKRKISTIDLMFNSGSCDKDHLDRYGVDRFNIQRVNPTGRQQRAVASKFNGNEMRPTYDFNLPRLPGCIKMQSPESA